MLVNGSLYIKSSLYPNTNWLDDDSYYVVDETNKTSKLLAEKIIKYFPYMELVIENGVLVDVIELERPEPEPEQPREPTEIELLQKENADLWYSVMQNESTDQSQTNEISDLWYDRIKRFYDGGYWTKGQVWDGVDVGKISEEQYTEITGDEYPTERPS